ncbi:MAG TPA: hypothetical protein VGM90_11045 [Kofleriaceae bacterium]|jgi:hypothetical protein
MLGKTLLGILAVLTTACAVDQSEPFGDLPAYDEQTGGDGKADDGTCTDETYRAFLTDYQAKTVTADANPCKGGNDASFRLWSFALGQQMQPLFDRTRAIGGSDTVTAEAIKDAASLTATERDALAALMLVRPESTGLVGATEWTKVYKTAFGLASASIGPAAAPVDPAHRVTAYEAEWLTLIETSRPKMNEAGSYDVWFAVHKDRLSSMNTTALVHPSSPLADGEAAFVAEIAKAVPSSSFDVDAVAFQSDVAMGVHNLYRSTKFGSAPTGAQIELAQTLPALRPAGGGPKAYAAWATAFATDFNLVQPSTETPLLKTLLAMKPCGMGPDADTAYSSLTTAMNFRTGMRYDRADIGPSACP